MLIAAGGQDQDWLTSEQLAVTFPTANARLALAGDTVVDGDRSEAEVAADVARVALARPLWLDLDGMSGTVGEGADNPAYAAPPGTPPGTSATCGGGHPR